MTDQQPAGVDLTRVALANARARAKSAPTTGPKRRTQTSRRGNANGRDPIGLGAAIERLVNERGWEPAAAGGSILDQWGTTIAPDLVGKVSAERYDPDTGTLYLRPHADAYGTHLKMRRREVVARINEAADGSPVRALWILSTGPVARRASPTGPAPATEAPRPAAAVPAPVRQASDSYQQARAALLAPRPEAPPDLPPVRTRESASDGYKRTRAALITRKSAA
jgi:predicted nucleic acid-binding Zn ribbon protein